METSGGAVCTARELFHYPALCRWPQRLDKAQLVRAGGAWRPPCVVRGRALSCMRGPGSHCCRGGLRSHLSGPTVAARCDGEPGNASLLRPACDSQAWRGEGGREDFPQEGSERLQGSLECVLFPQNDCEQLFLPGPGPWPFLVAVWSWEVTQHKSPGERHPSSRR